MRRPIAVVLVALLLVVSMAAWAGGVLALLPAPCDLLPSPAPTARVAIAAAVSASRPGASPTFQRGPPAFVRGPSTANDTKEEPWRGGDASRSS